MPNDKPARKKRISPEVVKWLETVAITGVFLAAGYFFNGGDPFFVSNRFPWIVFAPVLIALRYGLGPCLFSVACMIVLQIGMQNRDMLPYALPVDQMLGGGLLAAVCGQFSSIWQQRLRRSDQLGTHAIERAQQVSRAYFMTRLSHDQMEQKLISKPVTLRQAMLELRSSLARQGGNINGAVAGELLSILSHYCSLESAAIYPVVDGKVTAEAAASCGRGAPCDPDDMLLVSAMESGHTVYQSVNKLSAGQRSNYLVVSPMMSSSGELLAVLLITEMPFLSLQRENLQIMGVLLAYCVEHVVAARVASDILAVYPTCNPVFASELIKMHQLSVQLSIESTLALLHVHANPRMDEIALLMEKRQRGLDHVWRLELADGVALLTLMPFSGVTGGEGYVARISKLLRERFDITMNDGIVSCRLLQVVPSIAPLEHLREILRLEGIGD